LQVILAEVFGAVFLNGRALAAFSLCKSILFFCMLLLVSHKEQWLTCRFPPDLNWHILQGFQIFQHPWQMLLTDVFPNARDNRFDVVVRAVSKKQVFYICYFLSHKRSSSFLSALHHFFFFLSIVMSCQSLKGMGN
jgi:uncharacterized membrane protein (DUF485 family)